MVQNRNAYEVLKELRKESKEIVPTITISEAMKIVATHGFRRPVGSGTVGNYRLTDSHRNVLKAFAYYDGELTKHQIFRKMQQLGFNININTIHPRISELVGMKILKLKTNRIVATPDGARTIKSNTYTLDREVLKNF